MKIQTLSNPFISRTRLAMTAMMLLLTSACASAKKSDAPIDKAPEGRTPHLPSLKNAEVKVLWVPEKIEENRWEEGHFLYVIQKPSTWSVK